MTKRIMRRFAMTEISGVDRPAQAHAKVLIMKREFDAEARRRAASSGAAEEDGSFPIENATDLHNAMRAIGRSKNPGKTRAHIRARAKALGLESELSDSYRKELSQRFEDQLGGASPDELEKAFEACETTETVMNDEYIKKAVDAAVKPIADKLATTEKALAKAHEDLIKASMSADEWAFYQTIGKAAGNDDEEADKKTFREMAAEERKKKMKKAADDALPEHIRKQLAEADDLKKRLASLEDDRAVASFAKRATDLGIEGYGETLRKAYDGNAEAIVKLEGLLKGLSEQVRTGKLFAEFGANQPSGGVTAADEMNVAAKAYREGQIKIGKKCTPEQAFAAVYVDQANAELKKRYDAEDLKKRFAA